MKLYIDDIRTPPDDSWHICRNISSAIRALDMFWPATEEIALDHDISHQIVMGDMSRPFACPETFEAVARYISKIKHLNPTWEPKITIHTSNYVGGKVMQQILEDAGFPTPEFVVSKGANRLETIL